MYRMVRLSTLVVLVSMLSFASSMSCDEDLPVNDGTNSEYPIVQLEAVCSETTITVTYEAQDRGQFLNEFGVIENVDFTCRNTTDAIVGKGLLFGNRPQYSTDTTGIPSATFPVGTRCTFNGCYSYFFFTKEYSFEENSCAILGPGYECSGDADCSENAICRFVDEETECECVGGYEKNGTSCTNIDECIHEMQECSGNALCSDTEGGYNCSCVSGYEGNGINCTNVDECALEVHKCSDNAVCSDTEGDYNCTCVDGYEGNGINCTNVDECVLEVHNCSDNAVCSDTEGGYNCTCVNGYEGDGMNCTNIDECAHNGTCSNGTICTDTEGSYNCACMPGYKGDGMSCIRRLAEGDGNSIAYGFGGVALILSVCVVVFALSIYLVRKKRKQLHAYRSDHYDIYSDVWKQPVDEKFCPVDYAISPKMLDCESLFNVLEYTTASTKSPTPNEIVNDALTQYDSGICTSGITLSDDYIDSRAGILSSYSLSTEPLSSTDVHERISPTIHDTAAVFEKCDNERLSRQDIDPECVDVESSEAPQMSKDSCSTDHNYSEDHSCCSQITEMHAVNDTSAYEELFWQEQLLHHPELIDELTESPGDRGYI